MTPSEKTFARRILSWILRGQRILSMDELCEALAVNIGDEDLDRDAMPSAEMVVTTCGSLVEHDKETGLVKFSHETVRPFLEKGESGNLLSHSDLAKTCLTYLGFPEFEEPVSSVTESVRRVRNFRFSKYAAEFSRHARLAVREEALDKTILTVLSSHQRRVSMLQLRSGGHVPSDPRSILHVLIEDQLSFIFIRPFAHETRSART
jgi:hypothetical protein